MTGQLTVNTAISSLAQNFNTQFGVNPSGSDLLLYAKLTSPIQVSLFNTLDTLYDGDNILGNSISPARVTTGQNDITFTTLSGTPLSFNFNTAPQTQSVSPLYANYVKPSTTTAVSSTSPLTTSGSSLATASISSGAATITPLQQSTPASTTVPSSITYNINNYYNYNYGNVYNAAVYNNCYNTSGFVSSGFSLF